MNIYLKKDIPDELLKYFEPAEIGLEETPEQYVAKMVEVFREVRRVLRDDGTAWVNLGDSYAGSGRGGYAGGKSSLEGSTQSQDQSRIAKGSQLKAGLHSSTVEAGQIARAWVPPPPGYKQKELIGIPWLVAFALRADGWYLRQDIVWNKPNPMPESVRDRCTKSHEYIFLLTKSERYHFDADAIKEPAVCGDRGSQYHTGKTGDHQQGRSQVRDTKNEQSGIRTRVGFNERWAKKVASEVDGDSPFIGNDRKELPNETYSRHRSSVVGGQDLRSNPTQFRNKRSVWTVTTKPFKGAHFATFPPDLIEPCILAGCPAGGVVLDPFMGSGTTGMVSRWHGRGFVGIELNPTYLQMARERIMSERKKPARNKPRRSAPSSGLFDDAA